MIKVKIQIKELTPIEKYIGYTFKIGSNKRYAYYFKHIDPDFPNTLVVGLTETKSSLVDYPLDVIQKYLEKGDWVLGGKFDPNKNYDI